VIVGSISSSIEYKRANDGIAINNKTIAGTIVQTISKGVECVNLTGVGFTVS